jgi:hypothetical protein
VVEHLVRPNRLMFKNPPPGGVAIDGVGVARGLVDRTLTIVPPVVNWLLEAVISVTPASLSVNWRCLARSARF